LDLEVGAYLLQAALVFGAPGSPDSIQKGLFCESAELVEHVVSFAEQNPNVLRLVADINARTGRNVCIYAIWPSVLARTIGLRKQVDGSSATYGIYEVLVTSRGMSVADTEDVEWMFILPKTMYTVRRQAPPQSASH
jgi:hypothetical protein